MNGTLNAENRPRASSGMSWPAISAAIATVAVIIGINARIVYWQGQILRDDINALRVSVTNEIEEIEDRVYGRALEKIIILLRPASSVAQRDKAQERIIFGRPA